MAERRALNTPNPSDHRVRFSQALSWKGVSRFDANEDRALVDTRSGVALVIDGASGLTDSLLTDMGSDAEWFAQKLSLALVKELSDQSNELIPALERANSRVSAAFWLFDGAESVDRIDEPSAGFAVCRWTDERIEIATLGDCLAYVLFEDGREEVVYDDTLSHLDGAALQQMGEIAREKGILPLEARKEINDILIANRLLRNKEGGYRVADISGEGISHALVRTYNPDDVSSILLCSDGYQNAVAMGVVDSLPELARLSFEGRGEDVLTRLRAAEQQDADLVEHLRFKVSDDASFAVLCFGDEEAEEAVEAAEAAEAAEAEQAVEVDEADTAEDTQVITADDAEEDAAASDEDPEEAGEADDAEDTQVITADDAEEDLAASDEDPEEADEAEDSQVIASDDAEEDHAAPDEDPAEPDAVEDTQAIDAGDAEDAPSDDAPSDDAVKAATPISAEETTVLAEDAAPTASALGRNIFETGRLRASKRARIHPRSRVDAQVAPDADTKAEGFTAYADMREYSDGEEVEERRKLSIFDIFVRIAFVISALMIIGSLSVIYSVMSGCVSLSDERVAPPETGSASEQGSGSAPEQTGIPYFNDAEASTTKYSWNDAYTAYMVCDSDPETVWIEGADGFGTGEWVEIKSDTPQVVNGFSILAGYPREDWRYKGNCRPCDIDVQLSDGSVFSYRLDDLYGEYQSFTFDEPHETTSIRVTIQTVYEGWSYYDTCIAEIQAF